jgi:hypothetical protein
VRRSDDSSIVIVVVPRTTPVKLEIEVDSDPISGLVELDAQSPVRFTGWIELTGALESARVRQTADEDPAAARLLPSEE